MGDGGAISGGEPVVGALVRWRTNATYGVITDVKPRRINVAFDNGQELMFADLTDLERIVFQPGSQVSSNGMIGVVAGPVPGQPQPTWQVVFPSRSANVPERSLRPAEITDPIERMRNGYLGKAIEFNVKAVAADLWYQHLHNELVSLAHARVDLKPHQVGVAHRVISNYPHRFLLCDEVGLGKTIEAAMIIKELKARKTVKRVLVLVPSGLQRQWQFELKTKFNETFSIYNKSTIAYLKNEGAANPWTAQDSIIVSHTWASWSEQRRAEIAAVDWDLIVVDEAHHARRQRSGRRVQRTNLYRLVNEIVGKPEYARRGVLFLTATPMQLQRHELYSLVEMLDPVLFSSEDDFETHIVEMAALSTLTERIDRVELSDPVAKRTIKDEIGRLLDVLPSEAMHLVHTGAHEEIKARLAAEHRLSEILIRNRRSQVGGFQPRQAYRWPVTPTEQERAAYEQMDVLLADGYALAASTRQNAIGFLMTTYQKLAASSSRALLASLRKREERLAGESQGKSSIDEEEAEGRLDDDDESSTVTDSIAPQADLDLSTFHDLSILLARIKLDSKARTLAEKLFELFESDPDAKVLVFTQFRETQNMLFELFERSGWGVQLFHGQLSPAEKEESVEAFRSGAGPQIMISTEAGGEGRNFQFCHILVNYDLPWNPMKVEQRIGRVDRIGQEHPVVVFNLFVEGTIEERVLDVLERRIRLFTDAVGGLEPILGDVEKDIREALRAAGEERDRRLAELAERTEQKVAEARRAEQQMADLVLDTKSFGADIARIASESQTPVAQSDYERFLKWLMKVHGTWVGDPDDKGVHKIEFHPPFAIAHADVLNGESRRRVCLDPTRHVDSDLVEYVGFGHPVIDTMTQLIIDEHPDSAASVRRIRSAAPGWQFTWIVRIGGLHERTFVHSTFVDDGGEVDPVMGTNLLWASRQFEREDSGDVPDVGSLESAHATALAEVGALVANLDVEAASESASRLDVETSRIHALHDNRKSAAADKLASAQRTLAKMSASANEHERNVIPMWASNVERAERELERIDEDREAALAELRRRLRPSSSYELLSVARIVVNDT